MSIRKTDLDVRDVMLPLDRVPVVKPDTMFRDMLELMGVHRLGVACVVEADGTLAGVVTDGDIRRLLLTSQKPFAALFADDCIQHAHRDPYTVDAGSSLADAVMLLEQKQVWDLPVVEGRKLVGMLHLHPAIKAVLGL